MLQTYGLTVRVTNMKNKIIQYLSILTLCLSLNLATTTEVAAQCPMCRMSAENNLKEGGTAGRGLNNGILYMFAAPYLIVGVVGFIWYKNRKREEDLFEEELV